MIRLQKILVPVDFSEQSLAAVRYVKGLASHFGAEAVLLHVVAPAHYSVVPMDAGAVTYVDTTQPDQHLEELAQSQLGGLSTKCVVFQGDPARIIADYANSEQIDCIVMPTHGYGPFRRFLLGSVTAKVLHDVHCPVLTGVHLEEAPAWDSIPRGTVVGAIDLGPESEKVLRWAAQMASEFGGRLLVIHATPNLQAHAGDYFDPNWRVMLENQARTRLQEIQEKLAIRADVLTDTGDPPKVVRRTAEQNRAALVVTGRGSAAGIFGRLRANAYAIIRESPCPVMSV